MLHSAVQPFRSMLALAVLLIGTCHLQADDTEVFSGPQAGEILPPLKVMLVHGKGVSGTVDFIELASGKPTLLVIVSGTNRPAASLTRCLMNYAEMQPNKLFAGTVYLDADPSAAESYLRQTPSWWGVGPPLGISVEGAEGPGSYGFNRNVNVTVLVADKNRVVANFSLIQPSLVDVPKILKQVASLTGGRVPSIPEVEFLSMPTHKPPQVAWPAAPADPAFRQLICSALAAQDSSSAQTAARQLDEFVGHDSARQSILGNSASVIIDGRGKTSLRDQPIVPYLKDWAQRFGAQDRKRTK